MFTLHHVGKGVWSLAMGPSIPIKPDPDLIVVTESDATAWLFKMLKDLPQEQLMVFTGIQKIVNAELARLPYPEAPEAPGDPAVWPKCDGTERLQHLLSVFPRERILMINAIKQIVTAAIRHKTTPSK